MTERIHNTQRSETGVEKGKIKTEQSGLRRISPALEKKAAEKKVKYDPRKTASAFANLTPLVYETLSEDNGDDTQGYHSKLEEGITQRVPGENRESTYREACNTLRSQGKSMQEIAESLINDERVIAALNLGQMTETQHQVQIGRFMNSLAEFYPGAKQLKDKARKIAGPSDW